jgi:peroxiredoxin
MRHVLAVALALVVAAALVVGAMYATAPPATRVKVGDRAPALTLPQLTGGAPVSIPGLGQAPVILVIFDLRFPNAAYRLTEIDRMNRRYVTRGLRVVGVSLDAETEPVRTAAAMAGVTFPILRDPGGAALRETYGVPPDFRAFLISRTGVVDAVYRESFNWRRNEVREQLEAHLAPPLPTW